MRMLLSELCGFDCVQVLRLPREMTDAVLKGALSMVASHCANLEDLSIPCAANLPPLQRCAKLRSVHLLKCDSEAAAKSFRHFAKLPAVQERLEKLSLSGVKKFSKAILSAVVNLKKVKSFSLHDYGEFTNMQVFTRRQNLNFLNQ